MKYMILIAGEEPDTPPSEEDQAAEMDQWYAYDAALKDAGAYVAGEALQPSATATTVRVRNDETLLTDGPFAETKEVLGGFYLIDVDDLDEALDWAAKCPSSRYGANEVRPVMEIPELSG